MESCKPEPHTTKELEEALLLHPEEERTILRQAIECGLFTVGSLHFQAEAKEELRQRQEESEIPDQ